MGQVRLTVIIIIIIIRFRLYSSFALNVHRRLCVIVSGVRLFTRITVVTTLDDRKSRTTKISRLKIGKKK